MEIILSSNCKSFTGTIDAGLGYFIVHRKNGFFSVRSKHPAPPDGHWRFIIDCAELAQSGFMVADIKIDWLELQSALREAHHWVAADAVFRNADRHIKLKYDADDIINLKITFGL